MLIHCIYTRCVRTALSRWSFHSLDTLLLPYGSPRMLSNGMVAMPSIVAQWGLARIQFLCDSPLGGNDDHLLRVRDANGDVYASVRCQSFPQVQDALRKLWGNRSDSAQRLVWPCVGMDSEGTQGSIQPRLDIAIEPVVFFEEEEHCTAQQTTVEDPVPGWMPCMPFCVRH